MTSFLEAKNFVYRFHGTGFGIQGINLSIAAGSKSVIMGANGSGKTTLFLGLNGSLRPQNGKILLDGEEVTYSTSFLRRWRSRVGLVLQDPNAQLIGGSVAEDISLGPRNLGLSKSEVTERLEASLHALGIAELRHRSIHELSYGQKKRVAIAGIIAMRPSVLLLDEPTAGLDARGTRELMRTLNDFHKSGMALVLSTHNSNLAFSWAHQVVVLEQGQIVVSNSPQEAFREVQQLGLDCVEMPLILDV